MHIVAKHSVSETVFSHGPNSGVQEWCPNSADMPWSTNQKKPGEYQWPTAEVSRVTRDGGGGVRGGVLGAGVVGTGYLVVGAPCTRVPGPCTTKPGPVLLSLASLYC